MQQSKHYLAAFLAFFIWGFFSLGLKPISYVNSFDILFYRISFAAVFILLFMGLFQYRLIKKDFQTFTKLPREDRRKTVFLTLIGAAFLGLNWFLFIFVVNKINVQSASFAYLICPIITAFLANIILKEDLKKHQWMAICISFTGCVIYFFTNSSHLLYAVIIAASYSFYLISQRSNIFLEKFTILAIQILLIFFVILPYFLIKGFYIPKYVSFYAYATVIALLFTLVPLYLNLFALKGAKASTVGILLYINPIITLLIAVYYYKEEVNVFQIASYLLILCSIIIYNKDYIIKKQPPIIKDLQ